MVAPLVDCDLPVTMVRKKKFASRTVSTDNDVPLFAVDPRYYVIRDVIVI